MLNHMELHYFYCKASTLVLFTFASVKYDQLCTVGFTSAIKRHKYGRLQQQKHKQSTMKSVKTNTTMLLLFYTATQQHINTASRQLYRTKLKSLLLPGRNCNEQASSRLPTSKAEFSLHTSWHQIWGDVRLHLLLTSPLDGNGQRQAPGLLTRGTHWTRSEPHSSPGRAGEKSLAPARERRCTSTHS
jgi:hypothetical protein